jgi:CRISPR type II-A-associated protein Csn2
MNLIKEKWENQIEILSSKPTKIIFENINLLHKCVKEIKSLCKGEEGTFAIFDKSNYISFEKEVEIIPNILEISLNNTKSLSYLRKKIEKEISKTDLIFEVEKLKDNQVDLLKKIQKNTLINFEFNDEYELNDLFKFYGVKFYEEYDSLLELLIKYLQIIKDYSKTKVIFLVFAFHYFNFDEINEIIKFCIFNDIILVFLEYKTPLETISINDIQSIYIDNDIII